MGIDMVYSFHHFYYWVRGGLEYAQAYRAKALRRIGVDARFVFTTMFPDTAIWQVMEEMGFLDSEVLWLNGFYGLQSLTGYLYIGTAQSVFR